MKDKIEKAVEQLENVKLKLDYVIAHMECCGIDDGIAQALLQGTIDNINKVEI